MKTLSLISALLLTFSMTLFQVRAQETIPPPKVVFMIVEEMPEFPGGQDALREFIIENVRYPKVAHENGIQGRVFTRFVVETDGSVTEAQIVKGVDPSLDEEALRVVNAMPKWKPGRQRGENVRVSYAIPINFALSDDIQPVKDQTVTVSFAGDRMILTGKTSLIEKMRPYLHTGKPAVGMAKETVSLVFQPSDDPMKDVTFFVVEEMPEFPGGEMALRQHIATQVKYPQEAFKDSIQGRVYVTFIVASDGTVKEPKIARGVHPLLDAEAIRVISGLPAWKPGRQKGEEVNVSYTIPISFVLQ